MWLTLHLFFIFLSSDLHLKEHTGSYIQKGWRRRGTSQSENKKTNEKVIHQRVDGGLDWGKWLDLEIMTKKLVGIFTTPPLQTPAKLPLCTCHQLWSTLPRSWKFCQASWHHDNAPLQLSIKKSDFWPQSTFLLMCAIQSRSNQSMSNKLLY